MSGRPKGHVAAPKNGSPLCACGCGVKTSHASVKYRVGHRPKVPAEDRFWAKVDKSGSCWLWTASLVSNGYGSFYADGSRLAHRFSFELTNGAIPDGLHIDHLCRNRRCVNPDHLEAVLPSENTRRGLGPAAWRRLRAEEAARGTCPAGHTWTPETTYYRPTDGFRECRTCRRERDAMRKARRTAA